jgi:DNA-3-methyladenine glycosylase II
MQTSITLPATAPFDFGASLRFLRDFPAMTGEQATTTQALTKAIRADGHTVVASLTALPDGQPGLHADLHSAEPLPSSAEDAAADRLSFFLGLDDDLSEFYALGRADPGFAPVLARLHGYHQVKFPSPLENVVWAILSQRVPMPMAAKAKQTLIDTFDNTLVIDGRPHAAFPDLAQLTSLSPEQLTALLGNDRKAGYLYASVRRFGEVDEQFLRTGPYEQVKEFLLRLPGIGPWSAAFVLIRGLGRMDEIPGEKMLLKAAARAYGRALSEAELATLGERYGRWRGYWAHYLRVAA